MCVVNVTTDYQREKALSYSEVVINNKNNRRNALLFPMRTNSSVHLTAKPYEAIQVPRETSDTRHWNTFLPAIIANRCDCRECVDSLVFLQRPQWTTPKRSSPRTTVSSERCCTWVNSFAGHSRFHAQAQSCLPIYASFQPSQLTGLMALIAYTVFVFVQRPRWTMPNLLPLGRRCPRNAPVGL